MKDYLNINERTQFIYAHKYVDTVDKMIETWQLTKEEKKDLKMARTYGKKAFDSILDRLNETAKKTLGNQIINSYIKLYDKFATDMIQREVSSDMEAAYEKNRDYYKMVELTFDLNCLNCTKYGAECDLYKEFESHCVPSMGDTQENCKYAYRK